MLGGTFWYICNILQGKNLGLLFRSFLQYVHLKCFRGLKKLECINWNLKLLLNQYLLFVEKLCQSLSTNILSAFYRKRMYSIIKLFVCYLHFVPWKAKSKWSTICCMIYIFTLVQSRHFAVFFPRFEAQKINRKCILHIYPIHDCKSPGPRHA